MQFYMESFFSIIYLIFAITSGIILLSRSKSQEQTLIGLSVLLLGLGDSTHLIPRVFALYHSDFFRFAVSLGIGKLITSITMTIFYLLLYLFIKRKYEYKNITIDKVFYLLVVIRIALCLLSANRWTIIGGNYIMGIVRNIPFAMIGIIIIVIALKYVRKHNDSYKNLDIYVTLSFIFYLIVVLFASSIPILGIMMIPKTVCYVLIIISGLIMFLKKAK